MIHPAAPHVAGRSTGSGPEPAALELSGIRFAFDGATEVLKGIDLRVEHREIVALLGPSGCGKTTLLRAIAGLVRPDAGSVALGGRTVFGAGVWVPTEHRHVGLVPQEGALFPHLDVGRNVAFGLRDIPRTLRGARVAECLELVGLAGSERRRPGELSGGQQQRVALARALAPRPSVVLLDEPFSALDATLRAHLREDVRGVLRAAGATAVLVTHDQEEALSFADRVAVMRDGTLAQVADPVTLYQHPADLQVAEFVGESVLLPAELLVDGGRRARCALGELVVDGAGPRLRAGAAQAVIRPEQLELRAPDGGSGAEATVVAATYFGHDALVRLRLDGTIGGGTEVLARIHHHRLPDLGARVQVVVRGAVPVFPVAGGAARDDDEPVA
jgi:iron(III) transport system ATP-binding protein